MRSDKKRFSHLSLNDSKSIKSVLDALSQGLNKGEMIFKDDDDEFVLNPGGLLRLKISASKSDNRHKVNIKISWEVEQEEPKKNSCLTISSTHSSKGKSRI